MYDSRSSKYNKLTCGHILHWYFLGGCGPPICGFKCDECVGFAVSGCGTTSKLAGGLPLLLPPAPRYWSSPKNQKNI
ncbi:hypothetical protein PV326_012514 [Microctonus aethiopoides]|nr:hypothetical protein PV326_012514 [Microctonus aethiopoides]